ncbi:MAG: hypothetical protein WCI51_05725 [Lentisphaerota bacterium]
MQYLEPIISGTITATVWVVIVFTVNYLRNKFLESELTKSFRSIGYHAGGDGWGIVLHNLTRRAVKVRDVVLLFDAGYSQIVHFSGNMSIQRKVRLSLSGKKNKKIFTSSMEFEDQKNEKIIALDFEMSGVWLLSNKTVLDCKSYPIGGYVIVEYQTIFGGCRSLEVIFNNSNDILKTTFEHHKNQCETNVFLKKNL